MDLVKFWVERKLQLQELEKLRLDAYESSRLYKEKTKTFHDKHILRKEFVVGQKVLLFNSLLKFMLGKLRSKWDGSFEVTDVFPYGVVVLLDKQTGKSFYEGPHHAEAEAVEEEIRLTDAIYPP